MITIDPNLRGCGVACWQRGVLERADYVKNPLKTGRGYLTHAVLGEFVNQHLIDNGRLFGLVTIEMPRVYPGMPQTDLNDLLDVCGVGSSCAGILRVQGGLEVEHVFPSDWKGQVPKPVMLKRIWEALTEEERAVVQKTNKSDTEDILDAVGIGLWKLGRLNKRKFHNEG